MKITGPLCSMTRDGRHKLKPWAGRGRSGMACERCHKTWQHQGDDMFPTYPENSR